MNFLVGVSRYGFFPEVESGDTMELTLREG